MFNNISITGITPLDCYPDKCSIKNCKQNIKSLKLYVPCQKPDIESINEIKVNFSINEYKVLKTILGVKLFMDITSNIKIIYTALNEEQSLHSAHWNVKFCDFILLENLSYEKCNVNNLNLFIGLEDALVSYCDGKSIDLSLLYIICASFNYNNHCNDYKHSCAPRKKYDSCLNERKIFVPDLSCNGDTHCNTYYCPVDYYTIPSNCDQN